MKKGTPDTPKFGNGLIHLIRMDASTRQIRVNITLLTAVCYSHSAVNITLLTAVCYSHSAVNITLLTAVCYSHSAVNITLLTAVCYSHSAVNITLLTAVCYSHSAVNITLLTAVCYSHSAVNITLLTAVCYSHSAVNASFSESSLHDFNMSRMMRKPTNWSVRPARTQISLGIRPVWSKSSLCAQWVAKDSSFLHADSEDWSYWTDAQANLNLRWAHMPFCWFCHEVTQLPNSTPLLFITDGGHFQGWCMKSLGRPASSGHHCLTKLPSGSHVIAASTGCMTKFHWSRPLIPPFCHIIALIATSASTNVSYKNKWKLRVLPHP